MLGIPDPWVWLAYILCLLSALACVVYSWRHWNRGDETVQPDDVRWAKQEDQLEEKL
ncbi:MAG: hypothetical protein M5U12_24375 [Verrucomicrobia bacterium]|nr:hypothetical protein [Verrucomicrobiota bacterium]